MKDSINWFSAYNSDYLNCNFPSKKYWKKERKKIEPFSIFLPLNLTLLIFVSSLVLKHLANFYNPNE